MNTPHRYVSGAIDLGEVKARAEAREQAAAAAARPQTGSGPASFLTVTMDNFEAEIVRRSMEVPVVVLDAPADSLDLGALAPEVAAGDHLFST